MTNSWAAAARSVSVSSRVQIRNASGSRPFSRASEALLRFFGLNGKVQVLESLGIVGRTNGGGQIGGELPLGLDRLEDRLFSLGQLAQPLHAKLDLADHHLVQVAGRFLAVARDEGNGVPIVQELNDALDLRAPNLQVLRDATQVHLNRVAHVDSTRHLVRQERRRCVRPIEASPETLTSTASRWHCKR